MSVWKWLYRRRQREEDLDEEVQSHLRMAAQEHAEQGESAEQARASALREFGNVGLVKEVTRDVWGWGWLETFLQDIRYGLRQLRRSPGFTAIAVLTLALGIGANTAMFSVVNSVLLRPLPFRDPGRLVAIGGIFANHPVLAPTPHFEWADWVQGLKTLTEFSVYESGEINLAGAGEPDRVAAAEVSEHFFTVLGVHPTRGRSFLASEQAAEHPSVAIVSHKLWQSRYGSDSALIGKAVHLNGKTFTVIGVMPPGFEYPGQTEIWVALPWRFDDEMFGGSAFGRVWQIARLRPGATLDQARAELGVIAQREIPAGGKAANPVAVSSLHESLAGDMRPALLTLFGAVTLVLLIACANVAHLSFARGVGRFREVAVRAALGAGRARLIRQLLTESVLLALMGGALGLLIGVGAVQAAKNLIPAHDVLTRGIRVDGWVLAFTLVVAVTTGVISGLAPALRSSKLDLTEALKENWANPHAGFSPRHGLRGFLGAFETATAFVLLIGAGLLIRSLGKLLDVNPGFRTGGVVVARVSLLEPKYRTREARPAFFQQVLTRVKTLPGVHSAAFVNALPFGKGGFAALGLEAEGGPQFKQEKGLPAIFTVVSPGYFQTMGIPILAGRDFTDRDTNGTAIVAIISQSVARRAWPDQNPLGKRFRFVGVPQQSIEVVGVVGDVRSFDLDKQPWPTMYFPIFQRPQDAVSLVVQGTQNSSPLSASLRGVIRAVDKDEPISSISTMEQLVSQSVNEPRFRTLLLGIFAGLAFLLAVVGIYGIISYSVSQRTHELGVRMALGAERQDVLRLVVGQGMRLTLIGVAVGLLVALGLSRLLAGFLYAVRPTDSVTFVLVSAVMLAVALLASYIPARRATRVDPLVALRYE
jgi:putative ABC transport system permease protein